MINYTNWDWNHRFWTKGAIQELRKKYMGVVHDNDNREISGLKTTDRLPSARTAGVLLQTS